ncbi:MAG: amidohydrolase family protein [Planctomycetaceae bacterium]|nr:amidohydrolase family protein [Planctomycetaceae bacterium]
MDNSFVLKGDICYSETPTRLACQPNSYLICENGVARGVFPELPEEYRGLPLRDCSGKLIVPGLVDLHMHAPQYAFRGLGMDLELLDWLNTQTFPEESRYADTAYAERAYQALLADLVAGPNTRACIFSTLHLPATKILMDRLEASGLVTMVGKVNMDRNSPENLCEKSAADSLADTRRWLEDSRSYSRTTPILTPRFIPSCTDDLMRGLADLQKETGLPVQSHLSENPGEITWVQELCPDSSCYGDAYARFDLFGGDVPTIMAHCTWSGPEETELMRDRGVYVAHCPQSNTNLSSGIAPVRTFLNEGVRVGLGSDVAGGCHASIFRAMADAVQMSKMRWRLVDDADKALTVEETFFLGTRGGGAFFGQVGSFEDGFEFDAVVIDDAPLLPPYSVEMPDRLARVVYLSDDRHVAAKFVRGKQVK